MKQRKPNRLNGYDYSQDNLYFVTSCVQNMICCFGEVRTGRDLSGNDDDDITGTGRDLSVQGNCMILNEYGKIAEQQWYWLATQYPYVILHEFIVMPNHIHGIIEINRDQVRTGRDLSRNNDDGVETGHDLSRDNDDGVETGHDLSRDDDGVETGHDLSLHKIKSLSELMGAYKTTVSKKIHLLKYDEFNWQRSFYDHIIRDEKSYEKISIYIVTNPNVWNQDKFFKT